MLYWLPESEYKVHHILMKYNKVDALLFTAPDDSRQILQLILSFFEFSLPAIFSIQLLLSKTSKVSASSFIRCGKSSGRKTAI